jgi:hypothetical protein
MIVGIKLVNCSPSLMVATSSFAAAMDSDDGVSARTGIGASHIVAKARRHPKRDRDFHILDFLQIAARV